MLIMLRKQVDGLVNVYIPNVIDVPSGIVIPNKFASEVVAFKWLLCQQGARLQNGTLNWFEETHDNISGDYEVKVS